MDAVCYLIIDEVGRLQFRREEPHLADGQHAVCVQIAIDDAYLRGAVATLWVNLQADGRLLVSFTPSPRPEQGEADAGQMAEPPLAAPDQSTANPSSDPLSRAA